MIDTCSIDYCRYSSHLVVKTPDWYPHVLWIQRQLNAVMNKHLDSTLLEAELIARELPCHDRIVGKNPDGSLIAFTEEVNYLPSQIQTWC